MEKTTINGNFVKKILPDITGINLTDQEAQKLSATLRYETGTSHLFSYINLIYTIMAANLKTPGTVIVIPFIDEKNQPHLNVQRVK